MFEFWSAISRSEIALVSCSVHYVGSSHVVSCSVHYVGSSHARMEVMLCCYVYQLFHCQSARIHIKRVADGIYGMKESACLQGYISNSVMFMFIDFIYCFVS